MVNVLVIYVPQEDKLLRQCMVEECGDRLPKEWTTISKRMNNGRTAKQCRERWSHTLAPTVCKERWSLEEDNTIVQYFLAVGDASGNHFCELAKMLAGRYFSDQYPIYILVCYFYSIVSSPVWL